MTCPSCRQQNPPDAKFCLKCGARLAPTCTSCGTGLPRDARFCYRCGTAIATGAAHPPRPTFPESYTPKHLAEKILTSKSSLEGERKQVTVLFADLKSSLDLLADRDPEKARKLLDASLERMMEAVHCYEGTVNNVMGDGIMALFGAPLAHEDHAVRACYAALRMQEAVRRYSSDLRRTEGVEVQIRVGLNSGEVVVRSIGSDLRMDYAAVGETTHLAARMEQLAAPGSIRLTPRTLHLAEGFVQVTPLGPVPVKGLSEPVEVFELIGAGMARTRLEAAARRGLTRFVGRTAELDQLRDALERASHGHGQVVGVVGDPGVGKSRLFWELIHSHRGHGWLIVQSVSVSYGKATVYLPVIELLKGYFEINSRDDPRKIRQKINGKVLTLAPALGHTVPALLALLDVPGDDVAWRNLDPLHRRQQTLDAVKRLLLRESEVQPLVVVFEDLNWIDGETQTLLNGLVESLPASRIALLVSYRPEYQHDWGNKTYYRQLRIDPLPPESADELLDALLGTDPALVPLKRLLVERTEANPLFLEESVRALVETGALSGQRCVYRLTRSIDQITIPATVQAILAARIDLLEPGARRLLQAAAVIGKDVPLPLLLAIADAPESEVRAHLAHLQAAEFLYETRLFPDLEYTFKHALTHDVAYRGLLRDRQRALHARIVDVIERLANGRVGEQVERLAHHALRGEIWEKAVTYLRQVGRRAMARGANPEAIAHLEQALSALRHLPETRETIESTIDIRLDLRTALLALGDWMQMGIYLREAEGLARTLGDQHRLARIATFMVSQCLASGDYDDAVTFGHQALRIAPTLADRTIVLARWTEPIEVGANFYLGITHLARGDLGEAVVLFERNIALQGDPRDEPSDTSGIFSPITKASLADVLSQLGRFEEATGHADAGVQIAEATGHPFTLYWALLVLGLVHLRRGNLSRATEVLERALDVCRRSQVAAGTPIVAAALAAAYALTRRAGDAVPLVEVAVEEFHRSEIHTWPAHVLLCAGTSYLSAGRIHEAASHAGEALALTRRLGARASEVHALSLAGDVALARDGDDAEGYYREALSLAAELQMRPSIAHCHLGLSKLLRRIGPEQAQEHLTTATTMYREMEMPFWLEQAQVTRASV
jgi:class 3 adenylate cyclase/tetratricopeptide (TPR) repeat protein